MDYREAVELASRVADVVGVTIILGGIAVASGLFVRGMRVGPFDTAYRRYRQHLGRGILLGLEILVAADIIRTVAIEPTLERAAALALIVAIRTFLSFALEVELEGRWPWQAAGSAEDRSVSAHPVPDAPEDRART